MARAQQPQATPALAPSRACGSTRACDVGTATAAARGSKHRQERGSAEDAEDAGGGGRGVQNNLSPSGGRVCGAHNHFNRWIPALKNARRLSPTPPTAPPCLGVWAGGRAALAPYPPAIPAPSDMSLIKGMETVYIPVP